MEVEYPHKAIEAVILDVVYIKFIIEEHGLLGHARIFCGCAVGRCRGA